MKIGLVLEGGSMRAMFTAGVLDTFMDENISIDGIIGVSAGALFAPNFYSNQKGRALRYNKRFCNDKRYMSFKSWLKTGNLVNKEFAFYEMTNVLDVFDNDTYMNNKGDFFATVTNVETGKAEYLAVNDASCDMEILRATGALPVFSEIIEVNGNKYLDGGVADSIPVLKCKEMGYDKIIVVLTRPIEYKKEPYPMIMQKVVERKYKKYPNFVNALKNRYLNYNQTIQTIVDLENKKEIFVIRPTEDIKLQTIERNPEKLQVVYDLGVKVCKERLEDLKLYLKENE